MATYHYEIEQNTPEWDRLRLGRITGSKSDLLLVNGKHESGLGSGALTYARKKAAEWITGNNPYTWVGNQYTDRGHDLEYLAVTEYEDQTFENATKVGFVELNAYAGTSPDRLINDNGGLEVKCLEQEQHLRIIDQGRGAIDKPYLAQIQWNMWICEREWWDIAYYHPKFMDKKLIVIRIEPDPKMVSKFKTGLTAFEAEVNRLIDLVAIPELI